MHGPVIVRRQCRVCDHLTHYEIGDPPVACAACGELFEDEKTPPKMGARWDSWEAKSVRRRIRGSGLEE